MQYCTKFLFFSMCLWFASVSTAYSIPVLYVEAVVNGDMVSSLTLNDAVNRESMIMGIDPNNPAYPSQMEELREAVLDMIIEERIILQEAEALGITVSQEEIDQELEGVILSSGLSKEEYDTQLEQAGISEEFMREQIGNNILKQQLIFQNVTRQVIVTEEEILEYYLTQYGDQNLGKVRVALLIYSTEEDAEKYADLLVSGEKDFAIVTKEVSIGPNAEGGGDMGMLAKNELAPAVLETVNKLSKGEVSDKFYLGASPVQVKLISSQGDKESLIGSIGNQTRREIEDTLLRPKLDGRMQEYIVSLREKAIIEIR